MTLKCEGQSWAIDHRGGNSTMILAWPIRGMNNFYRSDAKPFSLLCGIDFKVYHDNCFVINSNQSINSSNTFVTCQLVGLPHILADLSWLDTS